jgi:hypothetical protein
MVAKIQQYRDRDSVQSAEIMKSERLYSTQIAKCNLASSKQTYFKCTFELVKVEAGVGLPRHIDVSTEGRVSDRTNMIGLLRVQTTKKVIGSADRDNR